MQRFGLTFSSQVPPAELEAVLLTHPGVKDAGVIGVPDENAGELPFAFVVRQPKSNVTKEELQKFVAGKFEVNLKKITLKCFSRKSFPSEETFRWCSLCGRNSQKPIRENSPA